MNENNSHEFSRRVAANISRGKTNLFIVAFLLAFSIFMFVMIGRLPGGNYDNTLNAAFMPTLLNYLLVFMTLLLLAFTLFARDTEPGPKVNRAEVQDMLLTAALVIVYVQAMKYLGFLIMTPLFMAGLLFLNKTRKWQTILITSVSVTAAIFLLFKVLLNVQLPPGRWING